MRSIPERRWDLFETKRFWCSCERCHGAQDLSRGFRCPECFTGKVFAPTPSHGPAEEQKPPAADLFGVRCDSCDHAVTKEQAQKLSSNEDSLKILVDDFIENSDNSCEASDVEVLEEFIDAVFGQHYLGDMAWEQMLSYFSEKGSWSDKRRIHQRRVLFHSKAYPDPSVQYAGAMEAFADDLCSAQWGTELQKERRLSALDELARTDLELAAHYYSEAHNIGSLMYGHEDTDVMEVVRKYSELQDVITSLPAKAKRPRTEGEHHMDAAPA